MSRPNIFIDLLRIIAKVFVGIAAGFATLTAILLILFALGAGYGYQTLYDGFDFEDDTVGANSILRVDVIGPILTHGFDEPTGSLFLEDLFITYGYDIKAELMEAAAHGASSTLSLGFHLRITGRPARFRAVREILTHLAALDGQIWRARRIDIARHFAKTQHGETS